MVDKNKIEKWTLILDNLKNGVIPRDSYERHRLDEQGITKPLNLTIDRRKAMKKWKPVLDSLDIMDEEKRIKISIYAEQHQRIEGGPNNLGERGPNLLPLSIRILSKLDNFEITNNPTLVEDYSVSMSFSRKQIESMGLDTIRRMESILIEEFISQFRDKKILVYMAVSNLSMISDTTLAPRMILQSRIKIIEE